MSNGKPFCIFKRGRIFHVKFKLPSGHWSTAKSTRETKRGNAERWAIDYLRPGVIVTKNNTLKEFTQDFFSWEGPWATDKRARGLRLSPHHCKDCNNLLKDHIFPILGEKKLTAIGRPEIRELRNQLFNQGYAGSSINKALSIIKIILEAALDASLIQFVPKIDRAAEKPKRKGVFTVDEVKKLFSVEWQTEPAHCHPPREEFMGYAGNLLACSTGLRMGEIQALVISDVRLLDGYIHARRSWDRLYGLKETTKTGRARNIIIPEVVKSVLTRLIDINSEPENPESFVFFAEYTPGKPVEPKILSRSLYTALRRIGISEQERRERNLSFHSHRYFFNSVMINARVPLQKIQSMTGHQTAQMSQHYYHLDDMSDVRKIQESIFKIN